ncbi:unnamed protein product [Adineta ricciae]|uniref:Uncharacterized protein n=1 Tax=Adineta ricciae TaxID=249248 RepID=A0A815KCR6_ADIRI|nr:unnamed protein product [Adineta ricciae]
MSSTRCIKLFFQHVKRILLELNLFRSIPPSEDINILRQQRHQTRLYLFLQLISLIILTFYASFNPNIISITKNDPSFSTFIELNDQYSSTLDCPCSHTSLEYRQFISDINVTYHEICSSQFVSSRWIELKFIDSSEGEFYINDIRYQSKMYFQLLSTLCRVAKQTVDDNLQSLYRTIFITNKVITNSSFQNQSNLIIEQFKRTVSQSYLRTLQLMEVNVEISQLVVPLNSDFTYKISSHSEVILRPMKVLSRHGYESYKHVSCFFLLPNECVLQTVVWKTAEDVENIHGMVQSVSPFRSVLLSTLECLYNETCFSYITNQINPLISPQNFSLLKSSLLSMNQSPYDPINSLVNKLFIQSWENKSSYESYFDACSPSTCQYTYYSRFYIISIITIYIGSLGGLHLVLHFLVPYIIKLLSQIWNTIISRRRNTIRPIIEIASIRTVCHNRLLVLFKYIKKCIVEIDLFSTIPPSQDEKIIRRSRRLTRIYLSLIIISLFILVIYTLISKETSIVIVESPSRSEYLRLSNQYPLTFQCSCANIAVKYDKFITQFKPDYHSICSNDFLLSDRYDTPWKSKKLYIPDSFDDDDYRTWIESQFKIVSQMCSLSAGILNSSLLLWRERDFITTHIVSPIQFDIQIKGLIKEFKRTTSDELMLLFELLQLTNNANQLATVQSSNWNFILSLPYSSYSAIDLVERNSHRILLHALTKPRIYDESQCSCALQMNCSKFSTYFYPLSNQIMKRTLPNFRTGCFPLNAMLQSTFSCLYNQTCLQELQASIYYTKPFPVKTLNSSSSSSINQTIEKILNELFVEEWSENISYELYYNECAPNFCRYSHPSNFNRAYFITKTLAIFGGLTKILHYFVSFTAKIIIKLLIYKKKIKVKPQSDDIVIDFNETTPQIISNSLITTAEANVNPVQKYLKSSQNRKDRIIVICLCLLVITGIVAISVIWIRKINTNLMLTNTSSTTTLITTTTMTTDLTKSSMESCYMTLVYQPEMYPIGHNAKSIVVIDFNKDSFLDLAVSNYDNHTISILFGNGNGTFQKQQIYSTGDQSYPWDIASGDFDNDTFLDIVVTLSAINEIAIFYGTASNGSFITVPQRVSLSDSKNGNIDVLEAADLNYDGVIDLLIGRLVKKHVDMYELYALNFDNKRQYRFEEIHPLVSYEDVESAVIGNFDNDDKLYDIGMCSFDDQVYVFSAVNISGDNKYNELPSIQIHGTPQSLVRGRFNDDELDDIAMVAPKSNGLHVLLARGDGRFSQQIYYVDSHPVSAVRINFNNDSIDDIAVLTTYTISVSLDKNSVDECFRSLKVADLNRDGKDDLVFIDLKTKSIRVSLSTYCNKHF